MSLASYLLVEKPNNAVRKTLAFIQIEEPIVMVEKRKDGNIDVWTKEITAEALDFEKRNRYHEKYVINNVDAESGEILGTRDFLQELSKELLQFK